MCGLLAFGNGARRGVVVKSMDRDSRGGCGVRSPSGVLGNFHGIVSPPAPRGKFHRGAWTQVVASLYPAGMIRTRARVAGFQRVNPRVESSAMRSVVAFLGRSPSLSSWAGMNLPKGKGHT